MCKLQNLSTGQRVAFGLAAILAVSGVVASGLSSFGLLLLAGAVAGGAFGLGSTAMPGVGTSRARRSADLAAMPLRMHDGGSALRDDDHSAAADVDTDIPAVNPANGMPMVSGGIGGVDVTGHAYGDS